MKKNRSNHTLIALSLCLLASCGGGGGGGGGSPTPTANNPPPPPPPPPPSSGADVSPGGIYRGVVEGCIFCPLDGLLLISESGDWIVTQPDFSGVANTGSLTVDGSEFTGDRLRFDGGLPVREFGYPPTEPARISTPSDQRSIEGDIVERESISAVFVHNGAGNTRGDFTYDADYDRDSTLMTAAGMYSVSDTTGFALTYEISDSGAITGSDSSGCMVTGQVDLIDTEYNMYRFNTEFSGCGDSDAMGPFSGLGTLLTSSAPSGESLLLSGISEDETLLIVLVLPRI